MAFFCREPPKLCRDFADHRGLALGVRSALKELGVRAVVVAKDIGYELRCAKPVPFGVTARQRNIRIPAGWRLLGRPLLFPLRAGIEPQTPASFGVSGRQNRERQTACWSGVNSNSRATFSPAVPELRPGFRHTGRLAEAKRAMAKESANGLARSRSVLSGVQGQKYSPASRRRTSTTKSRTSSTASAIASSTGRWLGERSGVLSAAASQAHPDSRHLSKGTKLSRPRRAGLRRALPVLNGVSADCAEYLDKK